MEAAERVRTLADWGLHELLDSEAHEVQRLDNMALPTPPVHNEKQTSRRHGSVPSWHAPRWTTSL
jgi:hypothetical protein